VADEVQQIDAFLHKNGSPMVGLGNVFVAAGRKYGVDPRLVVGIAGAESTLGKYAYRPYNAWGWGGRAGHSFGSWEESIAQVTKGLRDGYISQGRTTPATIVSKYAPSSDGNDEAQWASNVGHFMKQLGADPGASMSIRPMAGMKMPTAPPTLKMTDIGPSAVESSAPSGIDQFVINNAGLNPDLQVRNLVSGMLSGRLDEKPWKPPPLKMPTLRLPPGLNEGSRIVPSAIPAGRFGGIPVRGKIIGTPYSGTHTLGNWESDNAVDVSVPIGTPIRAPFSGTIGSQFGSLGEGGRFAGLRMHVVGRGNEAYLAHLSKMAPGIKPGARVRAGQIVGYSGEANGVPHLHFGLERGNPLSLYRHAA